MIPHLFGLCGRRYQYAYSLASWLLDKVREVEEQSQAATRRDVEALTVEVAALRAALDREGR